jgi:hypothetical protein
MFGVGVAMFVVDGLAGVSLVSDPGPLMASSSSECVSQSSSLGAEETTVESSASSESVWSALSRVSSPLDSAAGGSGRSTGTSVALAEVGLGRQSC